MSVEINNIPGVITYLKNKQGNQSTVGKQTRYVDSIF